MILKIKLWIRFNVLSRMIPHPTSFSWTINDFNALRRWARCQKHPLSDKLTLWDMIEDRDSVWALHTAEKYLTK